MKKNANSFQSISPNVANSVSNYRKQQLLGEVEKSLYEKNGGPNYQLTKYGIVTGSGLPIKEAQLTSSGYGSNSGGGNTLNQSPEIYSPLWLNSNLSLPRDKATINAWCRSFFALNPLVQNAISLHSTYPISKLRIKCHDKSIEDFFNEMIEEIDLMNICVQIAQEFWLLGESFIYADLNENTGKWSRLVIQNPDYMIVKRTAVGDPTILIRPDDNLKRIVLSNKPSDIEQKKQLGGHIVDTVKAGRDILLPSLNISHIARKISPYDSRGTGLPVAIFRQLMLFDKLKESKYYQADNLINGMTLIKVGGEGQDALHPTHADLEAWREVFQCHDEETEVLTNNGFKKFNEVINFDENIIESENNLGKKFRAVIKPNIKIACFNSENDQLEYHIPIKSYVSNYNGDMYHYHNDKIDLKVTPNHKLYVSEKQYEYNGHRSSRKIKWSEYKKIEAKDLKLNDFKRFKSKITWVGNDNIKNVQIGNNLIPVEVYLEFLGCFLANGSCFSNEKYRHTISINKKLGESKEELENILNNFCKYVKKSYSNYINDSENKWCGLISGKQIYDHFYNEINVNGSAKNSDKKIPEWILDLSPRLLNIFVKSMMIGKKEIKSGYSYHTTSKKMADQIYEIVYKLGFVPTYFTKNIEKNDNSIRKLLHTVSWSSGKRGSNPNIYKTSRNSLTKEKHNTFTINKYNGKVWCFEVPTGLFITRRNGKITIQGNSAQNNKDFKIFTHAGVTVEKVNHGSAIYDISGDITQIIKEIYTGLQVPSVLMDGGADTTYANGGVALDVLRQRYMQFRNMISQWLRNKIFAPICKIQEFYEIKDGQKRLIIPEVDWNHMSLFDTNDYMQVLVTLTAGGEGSPKRASLHTLYRSLGLEYEDEQRKLRREAIQDEILKKEATALGNMDLNELRALTDEDEITPPPDKEGGDEEEKEEPLPGQGGGDSGGGGLLDVGAPPAMPTS